MQLPLILLLLVAMLVNVATGVPFERNRGAERERYASWDDVNVVAHGLLQLGHGLKDHVDRSKGQMRDINAKLGAMNITLTELIKKNIQGPEGEALKTKAQEMEEMVENITSEVLVKVGELMVQQQEMNTRMEELEGKVDGALQRQGGMKDNNHNSYNNSHHSYVSFIVRILDVQNKRIDELGEKIRQQQDELEVSQMKLEKKLKSLIRDEETALTGSTKQSNTPTGMASDCQELFLRGERDNGVYTIQPHNSDAFQVLCEMTSEGGWTVIQKRQDGSQNFNQLWDAYQKGFGSLKGEFWMGLEGIHSLSKQGQNTLMVEFSDWRGEVQSVQYQFRLDGEENNYTLHLQRGPTGGPEMALNTGNFDLPFSTPDRDNDLRSDLNCAKHLSGGWWFSDCGSANLNGKYPRKSLQRRQSRKRLAFWSTTTSRHSLLKTTMKIKS